MRHNDEKELFRKLSQGTISKDELGHLNKWMTTKGMDGLSNSMDEDWATFNETEQLKNPPKWMSAANAKQKAAIVPLWRRSWAIAASILVLVVVGSGLFFNWFGTSKSQWVSTENTAERKKLVVLPDGSEVWLKRNSTITYLKSFSAEQRLVELEGEAFFDVVPDSTRPFIVQSDYLDIEVLGTSFNFISGKDQQIPEVALVEGLVKVSYSNKSIHSEPAFLKPGERASADTIRSEIIKTSFIDEEEFEDAPYGWKDDVIIFRKADVYEVAQILAEWYNIDFTNMQDDLPSSPLVHRIDTKKKEGIDKVLDGVSRTMPYTFQRVQGNSYMIKPR